MTKDELNRALDGVFDADVKSFNLSKMTDEEQTPVFQTRDMNGEVLGGGDLFLLVAHIVRVMNQKQRRILFEDVLWLCQN